MAKKALKTKQKKEQKIFSLDSFNKKELLASPQSYRSLFFGVATVIILFLIGFGITRLFFGNPTPEISEEAVSTQSIEEALQNKGDYTVKEGDTLWSIAEEKYGSGFEWYRIAEANNITNTTSLEEGTNLIIPQAADIAKRGGQDMVVEETPIASPTVSEEKKDVQIATDDSRSIVGDTYVIQPGDDLWDIAVRAYGDGYKWVDIAAANNLENPDLIHSDNTLKLPR